MFTKTDQLSIQPKSKSAHPVTLDSHVKCALTCAKIYAKYKSEIKSRDILNMSNIKNLQTQSYNSFNKYIVLCLRLGISHNAAKNVYFIAFNESVAYQEYHQKVVINDSLFKQLMVPFFLKHIALNAAKYQAKSDTAANHAADARAIGFFDDEDSCRYTAQKYGVISDTLHLEYINASTDQELAREAFSQAYSCAIQIEDDTLTVRLNRTTFLSHLVAALAHKPNKEEEAGIDSGNELLKPSY